MLLGGLKRKEEQGYTRQFGESGEVIILQILWENKETVDRERSTGSTEKSKNNRKDGDVVISVKWGRKGMKIGAVGYVVRKMKV